MKFHLSVLRHFWKLILKNSVEQEKESIIRVMVARIEKTVLRDHRLSSLGKPRDDNR